MAAKKGNYLTKKVKFQGKDMTMYSLDGITWSSRPDELQAIIDRHSTEQAAFSSDLKGEEREKEKEKPAQPRKKFAKVHNDDEIDEVIEDDAVEDDIDDVDDLDIDDAEMEEDLSEVLGKKDASDKKKKGAPAPAPVAKKAAAPVKAPSPVAKKGKEIKKVDKSKSKPMPKAAKSKPAAKAKKPQKNLKAKKKAA